MVGPLNQFNVQPNSGGRSMYDIGYASGPGGNVAAALAGTIDKYHQNIAAQQENENKRGLMKYENQLKFPHRYDASGNPLAAFQMGAPRPDAAKPQIHVQDVSLDANNPDMVSPFTFSSTEDPETGEMKYSTPIIAPRDIYTKKRQDDRNKARIESAKSAQEEQVLREQANQKIRAALQNF